MTDVLTKKQRSYNMSRIKGKDTKPEIRLRKLLSAEGVKGYRLNYTKLTGKPDIVFPRQKLAVFIDGCFWHKCPRCFVEPATRKEFWLKKIEGNLKRDRLANKRLRKDSWKILRFREHTVKQNPEKILTKIVYELSLRRQ
jgi:DNA mismatch endonuclease, patch repair protein